MCNLNEMTKLNFVQFVCLFCRATEFDSKAKNLSFMFCCVRMICDVNKCGRVACLLIG